MKPNADRPIGVHVVDPDKMPSIQMKKLLDNPVVEARITGPFHDCHEAGIGHPVLQEIPNLPLRGLDHPVGDPESLQRIGDKLLLQPDPNPVAAYRHVVEHLQFTDGVVWLGTPLVLAIRK